MLRKISFFIIPITLFSNQIENFKPYYISETLDSIEPKIELIHKKLNQYTKNTDEFISNNYDDKVYNDSFIRFENSIIDSEYDNINYEPKLNIRIRLPKLQDKLHFTIDNTDNEITKNGEDSNELLKYKDDNYNIGLLLDNIKNGINYRIKGGIKIASTSYLFVKASVEKIININNYNDITFKEELRYTDKYNLDNYTSLKYDYKIDNNTTFTNYNEYYINSKDKDDRLYNSLRIKTNINSRKQINYVSYLSSDNINSSIKAKEYKTYIAYRTYIREWLYYDIIPSISYEDKYDFNSNGGIKLSLGILINK